MGSTTVFCSGGPHFEPHVGCVMQYVLHTGIAVVVRMQHTNMKMMIQLQLSTDRMVTVTSFQCRGPLHYGIQGNFQEVADHPWIFQTLQIVHIQYTVYYCFIISMQQ